MPCRRRRLAGSVRQARGAAYILFAIFSSLACAVAARPTPVASSALDHETAGSTITGDVLAAHGLVEVQVNYASEVVDLDTEVAKAGEMRSPSVDICSSELPAEPQDAFRHLQDCAAELQRARAQRKQGHQDSRDSNVEYVASFNKAAVLLKKFQELVANLRPAWSKDHDTAVNHLLGEADRIDAVVNKIGRSPWQLAKKE